MMILSLSSCFSIISMYNIVCKNCVCMFVQYLPMFGICLIFLYGTIWKPNVFGITLYNYYINVFGTIWKPMCLELLYIIITLISF
jgi:hypothetical protein